MMLISNVVSQFWRATGLAAAIIGSDTWEILLPKVISKHCTIFRD